MHPCIPAIFLFLATVPVTVLSCEGECIVGITKAFLGNYTMTTDTVFKSLNRQIEEELVPQGTSSHIDYTQPIINAYHNSSYTALEAAIFPGYFHGKCQQDGVDPKGCPNPDCPVVCGTPGSLVHFYDKLCEIVFNEIQELLTTLAKPGSKTFEEVEKAINAAAKSSSRRELGIYPRYSASRIYNAPVNQRTSATKRTEDVKGELAKIFEGIPGLLGRSCGDKNHSDCKWEAPMKEYILSFP